MRKRIVIGLAALAVIGAGGYVFSQPRHGTVEYHKAEFLEIMADAQQQSWFWRHVPRAIAKVYGRRRAEKFKLHYGALIKLGYLEERTFVLSNRSPYNPYSPGEDLEPHLRKVEPRLVIILRLETDSVKICAPRDKMDEVETVVRTFDVPKPSNLRVSFSLLPSLVPGFLINHPLLLQSCQKIF